MKEYANKNMLKDEIEKTYAKFIAEFDAISEEQKDLRAEGVDRTPAENLAYQVGWTTLLLRWEQEERKGLEVTTPSDQFRWNQLGALYQWFTDTYAGLSLRELRARLDTNVREIYEMIDTMQEEDLFLPHRRRWADGATKSAVWPVSKFIHVNTVAPFKTFRTKIRTWKRLML